MVERLAISRETASRIAGAVEMSASLVICGPAIATLASSELPLPIKAFTVSAATMFASFLIADGLVDVATGINHQFALLLWKRFTKNEVQKQKIDDALEWMRVNRSKPF